MTSRAELLRQARDTFRTVLSDQNDPNARVIAGRRGNSAAKFQAAEIFKEADRAGERVDEALEAYEELLPATLDRFKI